MSGYGGRGQTALETLALASAVMVIFGLLLQTARMENERMTFRNAAKRAQVIATRLAQVAEHACDAGASSKAYVQVYSWSNRLAVRYREEPIQGQLVKGLEVLVPRTRTDPNPPMASAYVSGRHFGPKSIGQDTNPVEVATYRRLEVQCGNVVCGDAGLVVECREGGVRIAPEGGIQPPPPPPQQGGP